MGKLDEVKNQFKDMVDRVKKESEYAESKKVDLLEDLNKQKQNYINKTVGDVVSTDLSRFSDDELKLLADRFYEKDKNSLINQAKADYNSKVYSADKVLSNKQSNLNSKLQSIGEQLAKNINSFKEKSFKNNISRSSIASSKEDGLKQSAEQEEQLVKDELNDATEQRDKKVKNAKQVLDSEIYKVDFDYAKPIADKQNELQELKDSNSSYSKSLINRQALQEYDDSILNLVENYIKDVGIEYAKSILKSEGYFGDFLSKEQISALKKKYEL